MRKTLFLLTLISVNLNLQAQDSIIVEQAAVNVDFSADFVSAYVWRGVQLSDGINIQPVVSLQAGGFEMGVFGSNNFSNNFYEVDLFASYTVKGFTLGIIDYFLVYNQPINTNSNYFDYSDTTNHFIELSAAYEFSSKFPLRILLTTFVYGADKDENSNNYYSSYIELGYKINTKQLNYDFFIGAALNDNFVYLNDKGIINVGLKLEKSLKITDKFSLPLNLTLSSNPVRENIFIVFGITI